MLCAWLGALGLSAWYNQLFLPFSIFSNMLICILAWFILFLGLLKIALSIIPLAFISSAMNSLLKICLWPIEGIATLTDYLQLTYYMPCPPLFLVLLYYLLLAVILMPCWRVFTRISKRKTGSLSFSRPQIMCPAYLLSWRDRSRY